MATQDVAIPVLGSERGRRKVNWKRWALLSPALLILALFVIAGIFADIISVYDPKEIVLLDRLQPPVFDGGSWDHILGTDNLGRDILTRTMHGARISLIVVAVTIPLSAAIGTMVGLIAGWRLGRWDKFLMRLVDVQLALPAILFAILIAAVFGASLRNVIIIITLWTWSGYARFARGDVLSLREQEFIIAARSIGASDVRVILRHLLPNLFNTIVILMTLEVAAVILIEAALSFLGIGVAPGTASWGAMISEGRNFMTVAWWLIWIPGIAILLVSLTGNLMGDWLRDALDPRLRNLR
ncbi:MAG: peptide/nickel transport system permease protein [Chloroflexi bacterium]|jgi:peptide/nickel transport system permease protein|nr:MAG: peptide/nickel transport system permease protein [Chloroflexota bacterium]